MPFERLVEVLNPARSQARNPLFQVMLSFQNMEQSVLRLGDLTVGGIDTGAVAAKFDLQLTMVEQFDESGAPAGMAATFTYATDLFDESTVASMATRFERILRTVLDDSSALVGEVDLLDGVERIEIYNRSRANRRELPATRLVDVVGTAQRAMDVALIYGDESLTYGEFDSRVNRLARHLISQGVGPEVLVGVLMERSISWVIAAHAVIRAGGGYVPLDPSHPTERVSYVLRTAAPAVVLYSRDFTVDGRLDAKLPTSWVDVDSLDLHTYSTDPITDSERLSALRGGHPAYVIFTSGSTGTPKGVLVSHIAVVNQMLWRQDRYNLDPSDVVLVKTPSTFDVSLWELFWPCQVGARMVIAEPDGHRDPQYIAKLIREHAVTVAHFVPAMMALFISAECASNIPSLRLVFSGGEALKVGTAAEVFGVMPSACLENLYGPAEAAIDVTFHAVTSDETVSIPIGSAVWNTGLLVLDSRLHPVSRGVVGELYLSGIQLARGYIGRAAMSSDRFVANPFADGSGGGRMYRTGDLVRWDASGELEYIGRSDFQVKLRGQRIELGEIESALVADASVSASAVTVVSAKSGDSLVGYVVPASGAVVDVVALTDSLRAVLPSYMVPSLIMVLDAFPLNASGKLDRKLLPEPVFEAAVFRAPVTAVEEIVASVFGDVLGV
ncbi:non-ribosomal peptide synthetase, partial [Rhodococcus erythropolis]|uniref:non-ribosomal peptide synthetase n=1 Tax=Rhodococcus erythropolis TaxID=1833 RepID=UPI002AD30B41